MNALRFTLGLFVWASFAGIVPVLAILLLGCDESPPDPPRFILRATQHSGGMAGPDIMEDLQTHCLYFGSMKPVLKSDGTPDCEGWKK